MAKLFSGEPPFVGTYGDVCIYRWQGAYFMRAKSSLTRKRVLKDKEFAGTRKHASDMGLASRIGSMIYKALPAGIRGRWIYRSITGEAASLLYKGMNEEEVKYELWVKYIGGEPPAMEQKSDNTINTVSTTASNNHTIVSKSRSSFSKPQIRELRKTLLERWEEQGWSRAYFKDAWNDGGKFKPESFYDSMRWAWQ